MRRNFSEKNLGTNFCEDIADQIKIAVRKGDSITIVGMPLVGSITFCRYLATTNLAYFAYIDAQSLKYKTRDDVFLSLYTELEGNEIQKALLNPFEECKNRIRELIQVHEHIIIMISRLDALKEELANGLLASLKNVMDIKVGRITFIVTSNMPLNRVSATALNHNPSFLSNNVFFKPFNDEDFKRTVSFLPGAKNTSVNNLQTIKKLSGGHISLIWQLLKTDHLNQPMIDDIILLHLKNIYETYTFHQKTQLRKIALGRKIKKIDPFLIKIGLVKELGDDKYELFTPLLRDYILSHTQTKLTRKERLLFNVLKTHLGNLVTKDQIFKEVWGDDPDAGSDWALTALVYRLRKNPTFSNQGYIIENEKDEGYRMIKEN